MYSVAVMPVLLAAGWRAGQGLAVRLDQLLLFLLAAVLLLAWENLANDVFDADTGVDTNGKPHSVVNLTGRRDRVALLANGALLGGLLLMALVALRSSPAVLALVLACCGIGYAYQGPPFRLGYRGLGEPLCWIAFGPLATAAALLALAPAGEGVVPWRAALQLGSGPAFGWSLRQVPLTTVKKSQGGQKRSNVENSYLEMRVGFDWLTDDEKFNVFMELQRVADLHTDFIISLAPERLPDWFFTTLYGRLASLPAISKKTINFNRTQVIFEESL